jgi:uncharacterized protein (DUF362 family)
MQGLSRRELLARMALYAAAAGMASCFKNNGEGKFTQPKSTQLKSRVVRITNPDATDKTEGKDNENLNGSAIREMVDTGVKRFTGKATIEEAWSEIIPDVGKRVAIKVNCQIRGIYTKAKVVKAVTDGLILRGVPPSQIVIYDLTDHAFSPAGFEKNVGDGIKVGTNSELGGFSWLTWFGVPFPFVGNKFCKVLAGEGQYGCDYLINIPVLKALDGYSGVSISMKNHFGSISGCGKLHSTIHDSIAKLNAHELIRNKTRLIIVDAVFAEYKWFNGARQDTVDKVNQLIFGTDPVAIDYLGWRAIEDMRRVRGIGPIEPQPEYIHKAASLYGLGNDDPDRIDLEDL